MQLCYLSDGKLNSLTNSTHRTLTCTTLENYKQRGREIQNRKAWKSQGEGAMFTGAYSQDAGSFNLTVTGLSKFENRLVFATNFERGGGLYFKTLDESGLETPILADVSLGFFEVDVNLVGRIAVSTCDNSLERHISLLRTNEAYLQTVTEGDSCDCNPKWSLANPDVLYYDSAGIGYSVTGQFMSYGPRSVYRFNTATGELDEVLAGGAYEYYCPFEDATGNLYYIRRPYKQRSGKMSAIDYIKAPGKILRAFGGWLDFVTRRYTGETLKTSGANPAATNQKSPQQIFIDGNLLNVEKMLKKNAQAGDKNPGYVPRDWELVVRTADGEKVLHKSVMSYCVAGDGSIVYSNGKFIMMKDDVVKAHLAVGMVWG